MATFYHYVGSYSCGDDLIFEMSIPGDGDAHYYYFYLWLEHGESFDVSVSRTITTDDTIWLGAFVGEVGGGGGFRLEDISDSGFLGSTTLTNSGPAGWFYCSGRTINNPITLSYSFSNCTEMANDPSHEPYTRSIRPPAPRLPGERCCSDDYIDICDPPIPSPSVYYAADGTYLDNRYGVGNIRNLESGTVVGTLTDLEADYYSQSGVMSFVTASASSSIVRVHDGTFWYFVNADRPVATHNGTSPEIFQYTEVHELTLHQVAADGSGPLRSAIPVLRVEGPLTDPSAIVAPTGIDWSPFEDCLYVIGYYTDTTTVLVVARVSFDGTWEEIWSADTGGAAVYEAGISVSADGTVWWKSPLSTSTAFADSNLWHYHPSTDTAVQVDLDGILLDDVAPAPTMWGGVLVWRNPQNSDNLGSYPILVQPDHTYADFECATFISPFLGWSWTSFRPEDFSRLYLVTNGGAVYEVAWSCLPGGWYVGVMGFGPVPV